MGTLLRRGMPKEGEAGRESKPRPRRVKRTPPLDQRPALGAGRCGLRCHRPLVRRHDGEERGGPVGDHERHPEHPPDTQATLYGYVVPLRWAASRGAPPRRVAARWRPRCHPGATRQRGRRPRVAAARAAAWSRIRPRSIRRTSLARRWCGFGVKRTNPHCRVRR